MSGDLSRMFSDLAFGTSGLRGLVSAFSDTAVAAYTFAFLNHYEKKKNTHHLSQEKNLALAIDLRPSSPEIALLIYSAATSLGYSVHFLGEIPTPALALYCMNHAMPGLMVTGSHIPFDRNGIKFYFSEGEILKPDEMAINKTHVSLDWLESLKIRDKLPPVEELARKEYIQRYTSFFAKQSLEGIRLGLYEHSAVGRDITRSILEALGAEIVRLGRSDTFVPIDTEAVSDNDQRQAQSWCKEHLLHGVISTDGDGDRPLVFDEKGRFVRGDILGVLCAKWLGVNRTVVPVSCSTSIEKSGCFERVTRTKIGSPYVIEAMQEMEGLDNGAVVGFEANGGFLLGKGVPGLQALPTRDALLPILSVLIMARSRGMSLSELVSTLPQRFTYSNRLTNVPRDESLKFLDMLEENKALQKKLCHKKELPSCVDLTDGVRMTFPDGDIVHLRPSGNAPELRCYVESSSLEDSQVLGEIVIGMLRGYFDNDFSL